MCIQKLKEHDINTQKTKTQRTWNSRNARDRANNNFDQFYLGLLSVKNEFAPLSHLINGPLF